MPRGEHSPEERRHRIECQLYVACPKCGAPAGSKCTGTKGQQRASNHRERWQLYDPSHIAAKTRTPPPMTHLFYIRADNDEGDDLGLLVRADDANEAKRHWRSYYGLHHRANPKWVGQVPGSPMRGPIAWDDIYPRKKR